MAGSSSTAASCASTSSSSRFRECSTCSVPNAAMGIELNVEVVGNSAMPDADEHS